MQRFKHNTINSMKKLLFGLIATVMFSVSGFANSIKTEVNIKPIKTELVFGLNQSKTTTNIENTFNVEDPKSKVILGCTECGPQGCCILTVIKDDGTVRSSETCCKNIIVVKKPSLSAE